MAGANIRHSPDTITQGGVVKLTAAPDTHDSAVKRRTFHWSAEAGRIDPPSGESEVARWDTTGLRPSSYRIAVLIVEYGEGGAVLREREGETHVVVTAAPVAASAEAPRGAGNGRARPPYAERPAPMTSAGAESPLGVSAGDGTGMTPGVGGVEEHGRPRRVYTPNAPLPVSLQRARHGGTRDRILWTVIRNSTKRLAFDHYAEVMDQLLLAPHEFEQTVKMGDGSPPASAELGKVQRHIERLSTFYDPYQFLKLATEAFVMVECQVYNLDALDIHIGEEETRFEEPLPNDLQALWDGPDGYLTTLTNDGGIKVLPYLAIIRRRLPDVPIVGGNGQSQPVDTTRLFGILRRKLQHPCFLELIWSYWHEEGGLAQTLNHISQRFQNVRSAGRCDPLANLETDPLRPLNAVLWGYVQDDLARTSVVRRAHEYAHHYGFTLQGKALAGMRTAERRTKFLESFHNLLHQCVQFYHQDDDTTVVADGFPVLNSVKETHYLLAQGAHNQFGDLPSISRQEMLLQQWLLARPEMREFLGGRVMVPYPEPWMDRVDAMKTLQGWTDISVVHFHDLAVFGEQILLSVRYGAWSTSNDPNQAANWARYWRPEIQGYIHAYRAVTGVDLTTDISDPQQLADRYAPPSRLLRNRLALQHRRA